MVHTTMLDIYVGTDIAGLLFSDKEDSFYYKVSCLGLNALILLKY